MGTHPIFESDFDCLTDMRSILLGCTRRSPLFVHRLIKSKSKLGSSEVIKGHILDKRKPIQNGISHYIVACNSSKLEDTAGRKLWRDVKETITILNPTALKTIPDLAEEYAHNLLEYIETDKTIANENDSEMVSLLKEELSEVHDSLSAIEEEIFGLLTSFSQVDDEEEKVRIEISAGAGGTSAGAFVNEICLLYLNYFDYMGWEVTHHHEEMGDDMGMGKEKCLSLVELELSGVNCFTFMSAERGVHRIQRIPSNSTRIQTNTIGIKVMPILDRETIKIPEKDLKLNAVTASGKGGQKINMTRLKAEVTHIPTGIKAQYFEPGRENTLERNTEKAIEIIRGMLQEKIDSERDEALLGWENKQKTKLERGERMRNYSWNNGIVTDYNVGQKFNLGSFFAPNESSEILESIAEDFNRLETRRKVESMFQKYKNEINSELAKQILSKL